MGYSISTPLCVSTQIYTPINNGLDIVQAFNQVINSMDKMSSALIKLTIAIDNKKLKDNIDKAEVCSHCEVENE